MRPLRLHPFQQRFPDRLVFRLTRAGRQFLFLPCVVLKWAAVAEERSKISDESFRSRAAAGHPFWKPLVAASVRIGSLGTATRRFSQLSLGDFDAVAAIIEERLCASQSYGRQPMLLDVARRPIFTALDATERKRLAATLAEYEIPSTSAHGDLHFFNFVRSGGEYRIVDWENFDPQGSFIFDYLDFRLSIYHINYPEPWASTLRRITPGDPAVKAVSDRFDIAPRALIAHYLALKIDTMAARRGGIDRMPRDQLNGMLVSLRRALALLVAATVGGEVARLSQTVATCCAV